MPLLFFGGKMSILGSDKSPITLGSKGKIKINSCVYGGEARKNYNDNYDKIFGGSKNDVRQKENG